MIAANSNSSSSRFVAQPPTTLFKRSVHSNKSAAHPLCVTMVLPHRMLVRKLMEEEGLLNWQERRQVEKLAAAIDAYFSQRFYALLEETKVCGCTRVGSA